MLGRGTGRDRIQKLLEQSGAELPSPEIRRRIAFYLYSLRAVGREYEYVAVLSYGCTTAVRETLVLANLQLYVVR
jgi:hypothetical protein